MNNKSLNAILIAFVLLMAPGARDATALETESAAAEHPLMLNQPGDYVIYQDHRGESTAYLGIMHLDESLYILRFSAPEEGSFFTAIMTLDEDPSPGVTSVQVIESTVDQNTQGWFIADLSNMATQRNRIESAYLEGPTTLRDVLPMGGGVLKHHYDTWAPVFQLVRTEREETGEPLLEILSIGRVRDLDDPRFFGFAGLPAVEPGPDYQINRGEVTVRNVGDFWLPLNERWEVHPARGYARLPGITDQDAAILVETLDLRHAGITDHRVMARILVAGAADANLLLADTVRQERIDRRRWKLHYTVYDRSTSLTTTVQNLLIQRQPGEWQVITLSAFRSLYRRNRTFFDSILN